MKMFLDQRRPYNKFTAWLNGEYLLDSTGSNNKSVIGFWPTKVNALIFKKQLHDKIFNELAPARLLIELAFGSSNKQSFSGARPLNYTVMQLRIHTPPVRLVPSWRLLVALLCLLGSMAFMFGRGVASFAVVCMVRDTEPENSTSPADASSVQVSEGEKEWERSGREGGH